MSDSFLFLQSCRVPWRLSEGYFITKDETIKDQWEKMNKWIIESTK